MSGQATGWVLRHGPRNRAMRSVLVVIADAANRDGEHAHPGIAALVEGSLYSEGHVRRVLAHLADAGWIEQTGRSGPGVAAEYRVLMDRPEATPAAQPADQPEADPPRTTRGDEGATARVHRAFEGATARVHRAKTADRAIYSNGNGLPNTNAAAEPPVALLPDPVRQVFDAWVESAGKNGATKLDGNRRRLIERALRDYPLPDVLDAVRGWQHSAYHRGENDQGRAYNDLGLLLRNAEKIEWFRDRARAGPEPRRRGYGRPGDEDRLARVGAMFE